MPFHLVVGSDTSKRIVDCGRLWMLPKTLQYSGTGPLAGTIVAAVILVSFSAMPVRPGQSAAAPGAPKERTAATPAVSTAGKDPNLQHEKIRSRVQSNARICSRVFKAYLLLLV